MMRQDLMEYCCTMKNLHKAIKDKRRWGWNVYSITKGEEYTSSFEDSVFQWLVIYEREK